MTSITPVVLDFSDAQPQQVSAARNPQIEEYFAKLRAKQLKEESRSLKRRDEMKASGKTTANILFKQGSAMELPYAISIGSDFYEIGDTDKNFDFETDIVLWFIQILSFIRLVFTFPVLRKSPRAGCIGRCCWNLC